MTEATDDDEPAEPPKPWRCESCTFWETGPPQEGELIGECRRHPPTVQPSEAWAALGRGSSEDRRAVAFDELLLATYFPVTRGRDGCGEWAAITPSSPGWSESPYSDEDVEEMARRLWPRDKK